MEEQTKVTKRKPALKLAPVVDNIVQPSDTIAKGVKGLTYRGVMLEAAMASCTGKVASREAGTVSAHMLLLVRGADTLEMFLKVCSETERYIKSEPGMEDVRVALESVESDVKQADIDAVVGEVPDSWRQAKSDIKRAWEAGLPVKEYNTKRELKNSLNAHRKASKPRSAQLAEKAKVIIRKSIPKSGKLLIALSHLTEALHALPEKEQDKVAATIESTAKEYAALAKKLVPLAPKKGTITKRVKGKVDAPREVGIAA